MPWIDDELCDQLQRLCDLVVLTGEPEQVDYAAGVLSALDQAAGEGEAWLMPRVEVERVAGKYLPLPEETYDPVQPITMAWGEAVGLIRTALAATTATAGRP